MYDFPATPTLNQIVVFGSSSWQWNGTAWLMQSGNVGPQGPAGADGAPGAQGPAGPTGPAGPVGEAPNDGQQYARQSLAWSPFTIPAPAPQVGLVDVGDTPPASPLDRQQFWKSDDGTMWLRYNDGTGPAQWVQTNAQPTPASVITEQFFDLSGAGTFDIAIPSWAVGVQMIGSCFTPLGSANVMMRVSTDGTTFLAGGSDYYAGGPVHNTGSSAYANVAAAAASFLYLGPSADNGNVVPHSFTAEMNLVRPSTAQVFAQKAYTKNYDTAAATLQRTFWHEGWVQAGATTALALKALRIYTTLGVFGAGSWVKVNWLGQSNAIQTGTAIADAPSDGCEYTRVNGLWRLKSQTISLDGRASGDVVVPAGARMAGLRAHILPNASGGQSLCFRVATMDTTTFLAGVTDYWYSGFNHYSSAAAPTAVSNMAGAGSSLGFLSFSQDSNSFPMIVDARLSLTRPSSGFNFQGQGTSTTYNTGGTVGYTDSQYRVQVIAANTGSSLSIKALRFLLQSGANFDSNSYVNLEWVY